MATAIVAGSPRGVEERSGIDANYPTMPVRRNVAVHKKVVAHSEASCESMQVGSDLEMNCGLLFLRPSVEAKAGETGVAIGAGYIAKHLVVRAIFTDHQEAMF
jgi:hypothetical protein